MKTYRLCSPKENIFDVPRIFSEIPPEIFWRIPPKTPARITPEILPGNLTRDFSRNNSRIF